MYNRLSKEQLRIKNYELRIKPFEYQLVMYLK